MKNSLIIGLFVFVAVVIAIQSVFELKKDYADLQALKLKCTHIQDLNSRSQSCFKLGQFYEKKGNFKEMITYYKKACEVDNKFNIKEACVKLGNIFLKPSFKNDYLALTFHLQSCELKAFESCQMISTLAAKAPDFDTKTALSKMCDKAKNFHACVELEKLRFNSNGDLSDIIRNLKSLCDFEMFLPACAFKNEVISKYIIELNEKYAHKNTPYLLSALAFFCKNDNVKEACDLEKELTIKLNKECDEAQISSCEALIKLYTGEIYIYDGIYIGARNISRDEKSIQPFQKVANKACDLGSSQACEELAYFFYNKDGYVDINAARKYGQRACMQLKSAKACEKLAEQEVGAYRKNDIVEGMQFKISYLKAGCEEAKDAAVCRKLALLYDEGDSLYEAKGRELINQELALKYYDKECEFGTNCTRMAQIYLFGEYVGKSNVKQDDEKAKYYFIKECEKNGNDEALVACRVKELLEKGLDIDEAIFN